MTGKRADRLIAASKSVYADLPFDDRGSKAPVVELESIDPIVTTIEDDLEQARRWA